MQVSLQGEREPQGPSPGFADLLLIRLSIHQQILGLKGFLLVSCRVPGTTSLMSSVRHAEHLLSTPIALLSGSQSEQAGGCCSSRETSASVTFVNMEKQSTCSVFSGRCDRFITANDFPHFNFPKSGISVSTFLALALIGGGETGETGSFGVAPNV